MKVIRIKTKLNNNTYFKFYSLKDLKSVNFEYDFLNLKQKILITTKTDIKIFLEKSAKSDQSKTLSNQYKDFKSNNDMYLDYGNFEIV